jgi:hypothetical protein
MLLAREAGAAPEWRVLLRDLDRLQQTRIQHSGKDSARTSACKASTSLGSASGEAAIMTAVSLVCVQLSVEITDFALANYCVAVGR